MPTPEVETKLTNEEARVYIVADSSIATFPLGWTEIVENQSYSSTRRVATGDGQTREDRGNENPVAVNRGGSGDLDWILKRGEPPTLEEGSIVRLQRVNSDGTWERMRILITEIAETTPSNGLPTWKGTWVRKGPRTTGAAITPWPPVEA